MDSLISDQIELAIFQIFPGLVGVPPCECEIHTGSAHPVSRSCAASGKALSSPSLRLLLALTWQMRGHAITPHRNWKSS